jgi:hypothetical protein
MSGVLGGRRVSPAVVFLSGLVLAWAYSATSVVFAAEPGSPSGDVAASTAGAESPPEIDSGATAWMLTSTALVLLMIPGLAMFYGGLVRSKNVLGTMMHSFGPWG